MMKYLSLFIVLLFVLPWNLAEAQNATWRSFVNRSFFIPILLFCLLYLNLITEITNAQVFPNPATLSTGQGANGTNDPIWEVSNWFNVWPTNTNTLTYNPAYISNNCAPGSWINPASLPPPLNNGNWISSSGMPCDGISYAYVAFRLTLNLPSDCNGNSLASEGNYVLSFDGYVDNILVDVLINGVSENIVGLPGGSYVLGGQVNIVLDGPWAPGVNYVDFVVNNNIGGGGNLASTGDEDPYGLLLVANSAFSTSNDSDGDGVVDLYDLCPCEPGTNQVGCDDPVIINEYTPVTGFDPCTNSVTVSNPTPFNAGDRALIIQMKGATINLTNTAAFGDITDLGDAGNYEFVEIEAVNGNNIQLTNTLLNSYTVSGIVQLITVPQYTDLTVTGTLTCAPWDGQVGGVLVFEASGNVTLVGDIDVSGRGFRGGDVSETGYNCPGNFDYFYDNSNYFGGQKGEGIAIAGAAYTHGMGKLASGGGGGNNVNAGGGGAGNYGGGGKGGNSWEGCPLQDIGGHGGLQLTYSNAASRVFLGGGGGGGQQNNLQATPGTAGGGMAIIRAGGLVGNGRMINASAPNAANAGCDAAGGGGGGGTVLLSMTGITGALTVNVKGGNGAITTCYQQGASGGGGGGAIWTQNVLPGNVSVIFSGGTRGVHGLASEDGQTGGIITNLQLQESTTPWSPLDTPSFTFNTPCAGDLLSLSGVWNSPMAVTYSWSGPSGFSTTGQNVSIFNASSSNTGIYTLTVTDSIGCTTSFDSTVNVLPVSTSQLSVNICQSDDYLLPDGTTTVNQSGTYPVTLIDVNGCDSIISTVLTVHPVFASSVTPAICDGESHILPNGTSVSVQGTYTDTLQTVNGCDSIISTQLTVNPSPITNLNVSVCLGQGYQAQGQWQTATGIYYDTLTTNFGCDSVVITNFTIEPIIIYTIDTAICAVDSVFTGGNWKSQPGTYNDSLQTPQGCDSLLITVLSNHPSPIAAIMAGNSCLDEPLTISDASTVSSGNIANWAWELGNGNSSTAQQPSPQTYISSGVYSVSLVVWTNNGCVDSTMSNVVIHPLPVADFTADSVCHGLFSSFTDLSTGTADYPVTQWGWAFSDGQTSTQQHPQVLFAQPGRYEALLTVTNAGGCKADTAMEVAMVFPNPVAAIMAPDAHCLLETALFLDNSTINTQWGDSIITWNWTVEGMSQSEVELNHVFSTHGQHSVVLTVQSASGCSHQTTITVEVFARPIPAFIPSVTEGCEPLAATFLDQSTIAAPYLISTWNWDLGQGNQSSAQTPNLVFAYQGADGILPDTVPISLSLVSAKGCASVDTARSTVVVFPLPIAAFTFNPLETDMINPTVTFTDGSSANAVQWNWQMGDGASASVQHPIQTYRDTGTYSITLLVTTDYGCTDTTMGQVTIFPAFTFYVPNAFTPNSNGRNDVFRGLGEGYSDHRLFIFNRWGAQIFEGEGDMGWDGTYQGAQVQLGVYSYLITLKMWTGDEKQFVGNVNLVR